MLYSRKSKQLAALEEKWRASQSASKSLYALWQSYSSSIVTNIVENLQVSCISLFFSKSTEPTKIKWKLCWWICVIK